MFSLVLKRLVVYTARIYRIAYIPCFAYFIISWNRNHEWIENMSGSKKGAFYRRDKGSRVRRKPNPATEWLMSSSYFKQELKYLSSCFKQENVLEILQFIIFIHVIERYYHMHNQFSVFFIREKLISAIYIYRKLNWYEWFLVIDIGELC